MMPAIYNRKSNRGQWSEESIQNALKDICQGKSVRTSSTVDIEQIWPLPCHSRNSNERKRKVVRSIIFTDSPQKSILMEAKTNKELNPKSKKRK